MKYPWEKTEGKKIGQSENGLFDFWIDDLFGGNLGGYIVALVREIKTNKPTERIIFNKDGEAIFYSGKSEEIASFIERSKILNCLEGQSDEHR